MTNDVLLAKLAVIEANLERAERLKRRYEFTIGILGFLNICALVALHH